MTDAPVMPENPRILTVGEVGNVSELAGDTIAGNTAKLTRSRAIKSEAKKGTLITIDSDEEGATTHDEKPHFGAKVQIRKL